MSWAERKHALHVSNTRAEKPEILLGELPVQTIHNRRNVTLALVAVVDVVRVLPDVDGEQAFDALRHRRFRVRRRHDLQPSVLFNEPGPAGAELADRRGGEGVDESVVTAEVLVQALEQGTGRPLPLGRQRLPVEVVVPRLAGVVEKLALRLAHHFFQVDARTGSFSRSWFMVSTYFL